MRRCEERAWISVSPCSKLLSSFGMNRLFVRSVSCLRSGADATEQRAHPVPSLQQSQCLLVKLLLESQSRVPRRKLNSQRVPVELGLFGPEQMA